MSTKRTVAQTIAACLVRHGIRSVFSQNLPSAVALALEDLGVKQITYRTENAGAAMADGFARVRATPQAPLVCRRSTMGTTDRSKKT